MTTYPIHTVETVPELAALERAFGFVPSAAGAMANSGALLKTFLAAFGQLRAADSLTAGERQVLLLTNAVANECGWAVAFHTLEALHDGVAAEEVHAIRAGKMPADPRLAALSGLARALIGKRGRVDAQDTAGLDGGLVLDVVLAVAISTMTNYTASVAEVAVQEQFSEYTWAV
ncbi:carboxymuconolactone decarboxylase family protein [Dactylosporangium sp. NPDC051541]|uniref:carboxymuconolactone decarboxylase family protein n=1 Tax=Dactylosporangium sp. NPDC051541 TaxID=3363977 RepID=UPI0037BA443C